MYCLLISLFWNQLSFVYLTYILVRIFTFLLYHVICWEFTSTNMCLHYMLCYTSLPVLLVSLPGVSPVVLPVDRWGAVIVQLLFWSIDLCHLEISGSRKIKGLNLREPKGLKNLIYTNWFVVLLCDCFMILLELWPLRSQRWYCKPIFINLSKNL